MCRIPPRYDIDAILDVDLTARFASDDAWRAVYEALWAPGENDYRPDSVLFFPEIVARDLMNLDVALGNGFVCSFGYGGGLQCFFRGLRALRAIQHKKGLAITEAVNEALQANGAREPSRIGDSIFEMCNVNWDDEIRDEPEFMRQVDQAIGHLDDEWWDISHSYWIGDKRLDPEDPDLAYSVCMYLNVNRDLLRRRKG